MSDEALEKATGKRLEEWLKILDTFDVKAKGHTAAAAFLNEIHGQSFWWSQNITIQYEQERGLRVAGQRCDGSFVINVSKTIQIPWRNAWDAWASAEGWNAWFTTGASLDFVEGGRYSNNDNDTGVFKKILIRPAKNSIGEVAQIQFTWENEKHCPGSKVTVQFMEKSESKCVVLIEHSKLPDDAGCADMKKGWSWALTSLKSYLETGRPIRYEEWEANQK